MKEEWLSVNLYSKKNTASHDYEFKKFLIELIRLIKPGMFYFFHENWDYSSTPKYKKLLMKENKIKKMSDKANYFLLNIEVTNHDENKVKKIIQTQAKKIKCEDCGYLVNKIVFGHHNGEIENYGKRYWPIVKYYFWVCSVIALDFIDKRRKGKWYRVNKFIHCFMNQLSIDEAAFHLERAYATGGSPRMRKGY